MFVESCCLRKSSSIASFLCSSRGGVTSTFHISDNLTRGDHRTRLRSDSRHVCIAHGEPGAIVNHLVAKTIVPPTYQYGAAVISQNGGGSFRRGNINATLARFPERIWPQSKLSGWYTLAMANSWNHLPRAARQSLCWLLCRTAAPAWAAFHV